MPTAPLPLPIATYRLPSPQASPPQLVNVFPEQQSKQNPKGPYLLRRAPGISAWVTAGSGPIRGLHVHQGVLYAVSGTSVYTIASDGTVSSAFTGSVPGGERVRMETNDTNLVIVRPTDNTAYYNSAATTISQISDSVFTGFGGAIDVLFIDGYLAFGTPGDNKIFNTGLNALTFSALDVASIEGLPGDLVGMIVDHRELFLGKAKSCELWYDAANTSGSPFSRSPNGLLEVGLAAAYSIGKIDNSIFWLCNDKTVRRLQGVTAIKASQHGIESIIERMATISDAYALTYSQEGHLFYALTFPTVGRTLVYDAATKEWAERESLGYNYWRPNCIVEAYGMQLVGDSQTGKIGILDPDTHEEWGDPQRTEITFQSTYNQGHRITHDRFQLGMNTGDGLLSGQGSDPLATLKISDDGGRTFRSVGTKSLGLRGNYTDRVFWTRLGTSRDRVYRVEITDPVPLYFLNAFLELRPGRF